jgi:hypothetical protein
VERPCISSQDASSTLPIRDAASSRHRRSIESAQHATDLLQHDLIFAAINDFQHSAFVLQSFEERFVDSPGAFDLGYPAPPPNLDTMPRAELAEYESLLAAYIKAIDRLLARIHFYDRTARAILDGATDRDDLNRRAFPNQQVPPLTSAVPIGQSSFNR